VQGTIVPLCQKDCKQLQPVGHFYTSEVFQLNTARRQPTQPVIREMRLLRDNPAALQRRTKVHAESAGCFFANCLLSDSYRDLARMLVIYLDVTLDTLLGQKENNAEGWAQAGRPTSVLAACGRIERESHEHLLGWKFAQANMESAGQGASDQAGCHLFKSALTRNPNNTEFFYCKPDSLDRALVETVGVIKMAGGAIRSGGVVVIGSTKDLVVRLTDRLKASRARRKPGIEPVHVFYLQQQETSVRVASAVLLDFDRVAGAAEGKALLVVNLRAVQHLEVIESAFKRTKLIFFVGLPFTHQRHWPFDLMNSLLRELFEVCRETPDCRALFIMDKHVAPDRIGMLTSELRDIEFEDFYSMRSRLAEFLARYQHLLARPARSAV
jgi:hypothetical protein